MIADWTCQACLKRAAPAGGLCRACEAMEQLGARDADCQCCLVVDSVELRELLAQVWEDGARNGSRGLLPERDRQRRNPYRAEAAT